MTLFRAIYGVWFYLFIYLFGRNKLNSFIIKTIMVRMKSSIMQRETGIAMT